MAAASKSPVQAHTSGLSQRPSAARGVHSGPRLETVGQELFETSCSSAPSDTISIREIVDASSSFAVDDSAACVDAQLENSENCGAAKKPAWNKPSNGEAADVGAVMGAESWPALSDSARAFPKPSLVSLNEQVIISEGMLAGSLSPRKEKDTSISTTNHVVASGHRSTKHVDDGLNHNRVAVNGILSQAPSMLGAYAEAQQHNAGNSGGSDLEYNKEDTHRVSRQRGNFGNNELHSQNFPLRSSNGPQARANSSLHHRHGALSDPHFRESLTSQKRDGPRPFVCGPHANRPFVPPPPPPIVMQPYINPIVYHEVPHVYFVPGPHLDSPRPMPLVSYSPMFFPPSDPELPTKILNQIDYYFSNENLVRDTFLRRNMDSEGWVSIKLIAGFKKVMELTDNIHLILDVIQASNVVEVKGDKVRRRSDWFKWLMPPTQYSAVTSQPDP